MEKTRHGFAVSVGMAVFLGTLGGCPFSVNVDVKPSDCINPAAGECTSSSVATDSRILDVRLYQLKEAVDPCKLDLDVFAQGKELDFLKSAIVETSRKEPLDWRFKVSASDSRNLGSWDIAREAEYVLAVAVGRRPSGNSARLIPVDRIKGSGFPTLYFRGTDICLERPCTDHTTTQECQR